MELYYFTQGNGKPVIFLHSGAMDSRDWQFIAPDIANKSYKVITLDVRGAGKSPVPSEPIDYVDDLKKLLDHLDIHDAVLVGHSLGGMISTDFTLAYPNRVSQLILIAPGLSGYQFSPEHAALEQKAASMLPDIEEMIDITLSEPSWSIPSGPAYELLRKMMKHNIQKTFTWKTYEMVPRSAINRLDEIKVDTLLLLGEKESDDLFQIAALYKTIPSIKIVHIPDANHIITLTHPEEVSKRIIQFLK